MVAERIRAIDKITKTKTKTAKRRRRMIRAARIDFVAAMHCFVLFFVCIAFLVGFIDAQFIDVHHEPRAMRGAHRRKAKQRKCRKKNGEVNRYKYFTISNCSEKRKDINKFIYCYFAMNWPKHFVVRRIHFQSSPRPKWKRPFDRIKFTINYLIVLQFDVLVAVFDCKIYDFDWPPSMPKWIR